MLELSLLIPTSLVTVHNETLFLLLFIRVFSPCEHADMSTIDDLWQNR